MLARRLDLKTGALERYASPAPDLKPCVPLVVKPPCSPTPDPPGALPGPFFRARPEVLRDFSIVEADVGDRGARLFTPRIP